MLLSQMIILPIVGCRGGSSEGTSRRRKGRARWRVVLGTHPELQGPTVAWWSWVMILRSSQEEEEERQTGDAQLLVLCNWSRSYPRLSGNKEHKGTTLYSRLQEVESDRCSLVFRVRRGSDQSFSKAPSIFHVPRLCDSVTSLCSRVVFIYLPKRRKSFEIFFF